MTGKGGVPRRFLTELEWKVVSFLQKKAIHGIETGEDIGIDDEVQLAELNNFSTAPVAKRASISLSNESKGASSITR